MAIADQVKVLIRSHVNGDDIGFYAIAMQVLTISDHATTGRGDEA
jgi:hypothetical protein